MKKRNHNATCGTCPYWDSGLCRCDTPKPELQHYWPQVPADDWCGQHPDFWEVETEAEPEVEAEDAAVDDVCFLCGQPGADKCAHPIHWPGEAGAAGTLVHAACEQEECERAHACLSTQERQSFLRTL